jgi:hypothetical protein
VTDAEVQDYLRANGYPEHVVRGGKAGLVRRWSEFVERVERGYSLGLEDYRNDLDIRAILARAGAEDEDVRALDGRLKKMLKSDVRVWQSAAGDPFWDFGYPRNAGGDLLSDLRAEGLVK